MLQITSNKILALLQLYLLNMSRLSKTKIGRIIKDYKSLFYNILEEFIFLAILNINISHITIRIVNCKCNLFIIEIDNAKQYANCRIRLFE